MRKYTISILLVIAALVTLTAFIGYTGIATEPLESVAEQIPVSGDSKDSSDATADKLNAPDIRANTNAEVNNGEMTLAERIQFHDKILVRETDSISMAEKIKFHDRLWDQALDQNAFDFKPNGGEMTMAERILFHDRIWDKTNH